MVAGRKGKEKGGKMGSREGQEQVREVGILKETGGVKDLSVLTYSKARQGGMSMDKLNSSQTFIRSETGKNYIQVHHQAHIPFCSSG